MFRVMQNDPEASKSGHTVESTSASHRRPMLEV